MAAIAEAERELDTSLAGLEARELVLEKAREPELEYIFKHALVQEATYESIVRRRRRELHQKVAASIESLFADRLDDFYSLLAYHYTKAEDWEKAQEYLFKAADQAGTIAADAEALAHYEQAMDAYTRAFGDKWDALERAAVERKMGEALFHRAEHEHAREHLFRALALLGRPFPQQPGAVRRAIAWQLLRQLGHRLLPWLLRRHAPPGIVRIIEQQVWTYYVLEWMDSGEDQERLLLAMLLALNQAESVRLDWSSAGSLNVVGYVFDMIPLRRLARFYHRIGHALAEKTQEPFALAIAHLMTGMHDYWATGDWDRAGRLLLRARDEFKTMGRVRDWGSATIEMADLEIDQGKFQDALSLAQEAATFARDTGDRVVECWAQNRVGTIHATYGELAKAEQELRAGIDGLLATQPADAVMASGWLALCLLRQGKSDEARTILDEHAELISKFEVRGYFLRPVCVARTALSLGTAEHAQGTVRQAALSEARTSWRLLSKVARADTCGVVPALRLQGTWLWLGGRHGKAQSLWKRSRAEADKLGAPYEGALTDFEVGRLTGDAAALERAATTFETLGAPLDLARARDLLRRVGRERDVFAG